MEISEYTIHNFNADIPPLFPCDMSAKCKNRYRQEPKSDKVRKKKKSKRRMVKQSKKRK